MSVTTTRQNPQEAVNPNRKPTACAAQRPRAHTMQQFEVASERRSSGGRVDLRWPGGSPVAGWRSHSGRWAGRRFPTSAVVGPRGGDRGQGRWGVSLGSAAVAARAGVLRVAWAGELRRWGPGSYGGGGVQWRRCRRRWGQKALQEAAGRCQWGRGPTTARGPAGLETEDQRGPSWQGAGLTGPVARWRQGLGCCEQRGLGSCSGGGRGAAVAVGSGGGDGAKRRCRRPQGGACGAGGRRQLEGRWGWRLRTSGGQAGRGLD
ncbi:uncharacterized protein LOC131860288 [Cryptomeria japonica]|uniref:uncharacterized protein LOC131860288 n=1 Tax=Cryptomeria japonica TaxID=3369 RepID=UPI0027DA2FD1|nr:uncharacterized protein LOC131860288 [Cryptomeria japonica]